MKFKFNIKLYILLSFLIAGFVLFICSLFIEEQDDYDNYSVESSTSNDDIQTEQVNNNSLEINEYRSKIEEYSYLIDEISNDNVMLRSAYDVNSEEIQILIDKINKASTLFDDLEAPNQFTNEHEELFSVNDEILSIVSDLKETILFNDLDLLNETLGDLETALNKTFDPIQSIANYSQESIEQEKNNMPDEEKEHLKNVEKLIKKMKINKYNFKRQSDLTMFVDDYLNMQKKLELNKIHDSNNLQYQKQVVELSKEIDEEYYTYLYKFNSDKSESFQDEFTELDVAFALWIEDKDNFINTKVQLDTDEYSNIYEELEVGSLGFKQYCKNNDTEFQINGLNIIDKN